MGFGAKELIIVLLIVLVIFGTKRLSSVGWDLGKAIKGFRKAVNEAEEAEKDHEQKKLDEGQKDASFGTAEESEQAQDTGERPGNP